MSINDGSLATLWDVMDHYNKGGVPNPNRDGGMQRLGLTEAKIDDTAPCAWPRRCLAKAQCRGRRPRPSASRKAAAVQAGGAGGLPAGPQGAVQEGMEAYILAQRKGTALDFGKH